MAGAAGAACGWRWAVSCWLRFFGTFITAFKICRVPSAACQLKTWGGYLLGKGFFAALRASLYACRTDFAHYFGFMAATAALIIVNRHINHRHTCMLNNPRLYLNPAKAFKPC